MAEVQIGQVQIGRVRIGPADWITGVRAALAVGVAVLVVTGMVAPPPHTAVLVGLAAVSLALDGVDGPVARRTSTASARGARFDMEADAFLIAILSIHVSWHHHWWVLAIGAMRYLLGAATRLVPWLRRPSPPRLFAKAVAATQGIVLVIAATGLVPEPWLTILLAVALALLLVSFGQQIRWLWRHRGDPDPDPGPDADRAARSRPADAGGAAGPASFVAIIAVWLILAPPGWGEGSLPVGIPVEGLVLAALLLLLPAVARRCTAVAAGVLVAVMVLFRLLDIGFAELLKRRFDLVEDWSYLAKGVTVVADTDGTDRAVLLVVAVVAGLLAVAAALIWSMRRVADVLTASRRRSVRSLAALGVVWVLCATIGGPVAPLASAQSFGFLATMADQVRTDAQEHQQFRRQLVEDRFADCRSDRLLRRLQGIDVVLIWIESYGRIALQHPAIAPGLGSVLDEGTRRLEEAGYRSRSAYLTSPTFGAASWLAHATLQSGVWVDSERRYRELLGTDRLSLTAAFGNAGWRTVFSVPANTRDWPEGAAYYGFDQIYDSRTMGYAGRRFGYATMPDQYTLEHFRRTELAPRHRAPVMAEIDLISSHHTWTPIPQLIRWRDVGDGAAFSAQPGDAAEGGVGDAATVRRHYRDALSYTWHTLISFLETYPDPDRIFILVGDHQPHAVVTGDSVGRDVPVTVLSQDADLVRAFASRQWQRGLHPGPNAPVWRMDEFRDRWFSAYSAPAC